MRILVAAVGRARQGWAADLFWDFANRLTPPPVLREIDLKRRLKDGADKAREAEKLLAAVPIGATIVALDERGDNVNSSTFAQTLRGWRDTGVTDLAFLIGGADGLDETVRRQADRVFSFGRMTWPHLLVRGMLAEQLYRAQQILAGHPYHRD